MKSAYSFIKKPVFKVAAAASVVVVLAFSAYPQFEKTLKFEPETLDFGTIREEAGKARRHAKAINISPDSTYIISARTSCGCSGVEYSQDMLAPGDTADITIIYDPTNRPGKFLKTVRLFTGEERIGNSLKFSGTVIPSRKNLDKSYPIKVGSLRLSSVLINAGEMSRKEARPLFVGIYNDSDKPIKLLAESDATPLEAALAPDSIEPFGISTLTLMLKGRLIPEGETEILYKSYLIDVATGDTITCIPVGGTLNP